MRSKRTSGIVDLLVVLFGITRSRRIWSAAWSMGRIFPDVVDSGERRVAWPGLAGRWRSGPMRRGKSIHIYNEELIRYSRDEVQMELQRKRTFTVFLDVQILRKKFSWAPECFRTQEAVRGCCIARRGDKSSTIKEKKNKRRVRISDVPNPNGNLKRSLKVKMYILRSETSGKDQIFGGQLVRATEAPKTENEISLKTKLNPRNKLR
jgi:hypothetical protein